MAAELKTISKEEVAQHNSSDDCWIIMENKVYDVTKFLSEHPGGEEVITELAGQDSTDAFNDVGHSRDAKEMAEEYLIGILPEDYVPAKEEPKPTPAAAKPCGCGIMDILTSPTWSNFLIPTAIGIAVYVLYKGAIKMLV